MAWDRTFDQAAAGVAPPTAVSRLESA